MVRDLVDEKLRLQEIQRRKIVVSDKEIAQAIQTVESRNNMPSGALRARLSASGVEMRTLIDQLRVQIGWARVLRQQLGDRGDADRCRHRRPEGRSLKAQTGQPEYRVGEIFIADRRARP